MDPVLTAQSVHKIYRSGFFKKKYTPALRGIDLEVREGEIFGLLGKNGAGKTTMLNIFSCQLLPDSGTVWVLGTDITRSAPAAVKSRLNMCSGSPNFPWSLTVEENLRFYALLYGVCGAACRTSIDFYLSLFDLEKYRAVRYDQLSSGNKQKLALAKSLVNDPEVLFLDEPTIGLDPDIGKKIRDFIKKIHRERKITIILTTHYMKEAEELCDRIAFIKNGRIQAIGTQDELRRKTGGRDLEETFIDLAEEATA